VRGTLVPHWTRVVNRCTALIVREWGEMFPMFIVSEYPKSGGTWLGNMASDCLQVPFPQHYRMPLLMTCVIHNHWKYSPKYRRPFYLYRDGRDVMVSLYFHRMRKIAAQRDANDRQTKRVYEGLFGKGYDPGDVRGHLARFIENEFENPRGSRITWKQHIESWHDPEGRPHVAYLSYEQLLSEPHATLKRAVEHVAGRTIEDWRVEMSVDKFSMARQTGRRPGQEDRSSFIRKGVAGDWVNQFTRESAEVFHDLAGDVLIRLGYERDASWVERAGASAPQVAVANGR
jgi:hypothetical protein